MDTLKKILDLRSDPAPEGSNPREAAMSHIHGVLNQDGPPQTFTVGHAVAAAIEGIHYGAGEHGARDVHTVFMHPDLSAAYRTPLNSPEAAGAHRQIAQAEYEYWRQQDRQHSTQGTRVALAFSVDERVRLQSNIGRLAQTGQSFTQHLANEQTFARDTGNPVASSANAFLPSGSSQRPAAQGTSNNATQSNAAANAPKGRRR